MPIRKEFRKFYGVTWRKVTRPRILKRAANRCEQCGAPNNSEVDRIGGAWEKIVVKFGFPPINIRWFNPTGGEIEQPAGKKRTVRVVLTIAHLNHTAGDDRDENLKALCQWCHLNYDRRHHQETREVRKDSGRPLLEAMEEDSCF